jgi:hypothetical protein
MRRISDAELAWIGDVSPVNIGNLTHPGFPAYLRILHPAQRTYNDIAEPVKWKDIAIVNGVTLEAFSRYHDISPLLSAYSSELGRPLQGELADFLLERLVTILRTHTSTPARCSFMFHGSWFHVPVPEKFTEMQFRAEIYLASGGSCSEIIDFPVGPALWWPEDRAWVVASPLDTDSSFVGCCYSTAQELINDPILEALQVSANDEFREL